MSKVLIAILRSGWMPVKWRKSSLIPFYKNIEDIQSSANNCGIKLMCCTRELWERVIECIRRDNTRATEDQFGFMPVDLQWGLYKD